ncbi:MAG: glycosyltransferase, partial [Candidatus Aenigmarchaeota archaeon]|nr:glycosyltransferase [Candidatus Aenigmarchaeota archaeon]
EKNLGYGATLKRGIRVSKNEIVVITDADGTYPNKDIPKLIEALDGFDMVVGARVGDNVKISIWRKPAKWLLN